MQQVSHQRFQPGTVEASGGGMDEQRRAYLDHHAPCVGQRRRQAGSLCTETHGKTIRKRYICCDYDAAWNRRTARRSLPKGEGDPKIAAADPRRTKAVSRDYEPVPGQWYENLEEEEPFRVLSMDEDSELIEIEYLDGDIEEIDLETWHEMDLEQTQEPEGWAESQEEDEDEDDDDDWDDDEDDDDEDDDEELDDEDADDREQY